MDFTDILPLLIVIGGAIFSFIGKRRDSEDEEASTPPPAVPQQRVPRPRRRAAVPRPRPVPPVPVVAEDDDDDDGWIPRNTPAAPPVPPQQWQAEGVRSISDQVAQERLSNTLQSDDDNYAYTQPSPVANSPEEWRRAIIAHEILKTKF